MDGTYIVWYGFVNCLCCLFLASLACILPIFTFRCPSPFKNTSFKGAISIGTTLHFDGFVVFITGEHGGIIKMKPSNCMTGCWESCAGHRGTVASRLLAGNQ